MKVKEEKLIINDKYIYLKNKTYETKYIRKSKIIDYNNAKNEIEKILKENKLSKSLFNNKLTIIISNSLNNCEEFVIKSIFEELQINKITILKINELLFDTINSTNNIIIYYYEDYLEIYAFNNCYIIDKNFIKSIYNYIEENNIKKVFVISNENNVDNFIKNLKNKNKIDVLYNKNYIMQLFI